MIIIPYIRARIKIAEMKICGILIELGVEVKHKHQAVVADKLRKQVESSPYPPHPPHRPRPRPHGLYQRTGRKHR